MNRRYLWRLAMLIVAAASPAGAQTGAQDDPLAGAKSEVYRKLGDISLRIHVFHPPGHKASDSRPAIVFFFGGGWTNGSPGQFAPQCRHFASRGMVAFSADYRVYSRHRSTVADAVSDAQAAIRWVRANAKRLGVDPDRIAAGGGSAGGHLAAATATLRDFTGERDTAAVSFRPNALLLFNPALDLVSLREGKKDAPDQPERLVNRAGADIRDLSPMQHVAKGQGPCIIFHGLEDKLIPFRQIEAFAAAMKKAGNRCEVVGFDGVGHGFFNYGRGGRNHYAATLKAADEFLASLGWIGGTAAKDRLAWFREAKFGMFIHWGIYAVPAGEWGDDKNQAEWIMLRAKVPFDEYVNFATRFNPVKFDAREWVRVARDAGMKYLVITAKHHDGFCMFDTKLTDYNIVKATPYGRDPMKELAAACREAGLVFCFYYSIPDWHHPEFPVRYSMHGFHGVNKPDADLKKYVEYLKGQLRELLTNYGPIGILWFDDGGCFERIDNKAEVLGSQEIADLIHELQPDCLINDRLWAAADYGTPEQKIPGDRQKTAFEVCMTLNRHWGYNKYDRDYKTPKEVVRNLADIAHKGGNYLLNVGPTAEGIIPPESVDVLREVGKWMAVNGESIYATTAGPIESIPAWGRCTAAPGRLYLHVFEWPADGVLKVEGIDARIARAAFLADPAKKPLDFDTAAGRLVLRLPAQAPDPINTVIVLDVK